MGYFIGIDAGGTSTRCALADEDKVVARAIGGTIKPTRVSEEQAEAELRNLLLGLETQTGVLLASIDAACLGLAGITSPGRADWARGMLGRLTGGKPVVCEDIVIALDAAFPGGAGILVISGTGSNVMARNADGVLAQAGGLGPVISDEGSGVWIGRRAVSLALFQYQEQGEISDMLASIMKSTDHTHPWDLRTLVNSMPASEFAKFAPLVNEAAGRGDATAMTALFEAGTELAHLVLAAIERLPPSSVPASWTVAFLGSILEHVAPVRDAMVDALARDLPGAIVRKDAVDPIQGALWRARQARA